jgi:hypothetical protein
MNHQGGRKTVTTRIVMLCLLCALSLVMACSGSGTDSHVPGSGGGGGGDGPYATGIYAVLDAADLSDRASLAQVLGRSYVHGVVLALGWSDLEPEKGQINHQLLANALNALRAASGGKALSIKLIFRNGDAPMNWLLPAGVDASGGPVRFTTTAGFDALASLNDAKLSVTFLPTVAGYMAAVKAHAAELAQQLDEVDPDGSLIPIVQFPGPAAVSDTTLRLMPKTGFPRVPRNGNTDSYGFGWSFQKHLDAWKGFASYLASLPAFGKRMWTFAFTHQPPPQDERASFGLFTADQLEVAHAIEAVHPLGAAAVRYKNEALAAQDNVPGFPQPPASCDWWANRFLAADIYPEQAIAANPHHEWQVQVSKAAPPVPAGSLLMPRLELARAALFADPGNDLPSRLQHTEFVELHAAQVLGDVSVLPDETSGSQFFSCLDRMIRTYAPASRVLSADDQAFWPRYPSPSQQCVGYPAPPPEDACISGN